MQSCHSGHPQRWIAQVAEMQFLETLVLPHARKPDQSATQMGLQLDATFCNPDHEEFFFQKASLTLHGLRKSVVPGPSAFDRHLEVLLSKNNFHRKEVDGEVIAAPFW